MDILEGEGCGKKENEDGRAVGVRLLSNGPLDYCMLVSSDLSSEVGGRAGTLTDVTMGGGVLWIIVRAVRQKEVRPVTDDGMRAQHANCTKNGCFISTPLRDLVAHSVERKRINLRLLGSQVLCSLHKQWEQFYELFMHNLHLLSKQVVISGQLGPNQPHCSPSTICLFKLC